MKKAGFAFKMLYHETLLQFLVCFVNFLKARFLVKISVSVFSLLSILSFSHGKVIKVGDKISSVNGEKDKIYVKSDIKFYGEPKKVYIKKSEIKYKEDPGIFNFEFPDIEDVKKFIYYDEIEKKIETELDSLKKGRDAFLKGLNAKIFKKIENKKWVYDRLFEFWLKILEAKKTLLYEKWKKKKGPNGKKKSSYDPDHYEFYIPYYTSTYKPPHYREEDHHYKEDHYSQESYSKH